MRNCANCANTSKTKSTKPMNVSPTPTPEALPTNLNNDSDPVEAPKKKGRGCLVAAGVVGGIMLVLGVTGFFAYQHYFHAKINPVNLTSQEIEVVETKLEQIESASNGAQLPVTDATLAEINQPREVVPELTDEQRAAQAEAELRARRTIVLSERELNGMLNHNTDLGETFKVKFKNGYIDIETVIPMDEEIPVVGGKTLRVSVDLSIEKMDDGNMSFAVKSVNLAGVPMPDAWLGGIKGDNLIEQFSDEKFFEVLSAGIEDFQIASGQIAIVLAD